MDGQERAATPRLNTVQHLRALAAVAVVTGHLLTLIAATCAARGCAFRRPDWPTGAGVDLFFLISGFIMVVASGRMFGAPGGAREFLLRRLIRIVPLYWAVTTLFTLRAGLGGDGTLHADGLLASYLFLPFDTTGRGDGFAFPLVELGWTLNYEMLFYLLFAVAIGFGRERCVVLVTVALGLLVLGGALLPAPPLAVRFWTRPITFEFAAGMWLALLFLRGRLRLAAPVRLALGALATIVLAVPPVPLAGAVTPNSLARVANWGLPAALLLAAAVSGPVGLPRRLDRAGQRVGDASYSLYLTHPLWFMVVGKAATRLPLPLLPAVMLLAGLGGALALALAVHLLAERPTTEWLAARARRLGLLRGQAPLPDGAPHP